MNDKNDKGQFEFEGWNEGMKAIRAAEAEGMRNVKADAQRFPAPHQAPLPAPDDLLAGVGANVGKGITQALVRTVVPAVAGLLLTGALKLGVTINNDSLTEIIGLVMMVGYYTLVTVLERKVHPAFGYLLGAKGAPRYVPAESTLVAPLSVGKD